MRLFPAACIAALLLPATAIAGGFDKVEAAPESVELPGIVTLDLLASPTGSDTPLVWGTLGEEEGADACLVAIETGRAQSQISASTAEKLGLKLKKTKVKGGELKVARVPQLRLGEAVFQDVTVVEASDLAADACMSLSLPAAGLAWAVMPSVGKVHLAPATQGAELTAKVGGTTLPYTASPSTRVKYGKDKRDHRSVPYTVAGTVGGHQAQLEVGFGRGTTLSNDLVLEGPVQSRGDTAHVWSPITLGGLEVGSDWVRSESAWRYRGEGDVVVSWGAIGNAVLAHYDIAADANGTLALSPAEKQVRADPRPTLVEQAEKALGKCLEPEEPLPEDQADKPAGERCGKQYGELASQALMAGDLAKSLEARQVLAEVSPGKCDSWTAVGELQLALGDADGAIDSFGKASTQYHAWYDIEVYDRVQAEKDWSDLEEDLQKTAEVQPQAAGCHVADGMLALAWLSKGDADKVAELADAHTDLDPGLPSVYGAQLIMADQVEAAHGPWRMVEHLDLGFSMLAKAGLGRLFAQQGDWDSALTNYRAALSYDAEDATTTAMWVDDMAARLGPDAALDETRKWAAQRPDSLAAHFGVARAAKLAGKDPAFLTKDADALFVAAVQVAPLDAAVLATWSRYLTATGREAQGLLNAERAIQADPTEASGWLAQAEAQQAQGNAGAAKDSMLRAVQTSAQHPGYTLLMQDL